MTRDSFGLIVALYVGDYTNTYHKLGAYQTQPCYVAVVRLACKPRKNGVAPEPLTPGLVSSPSLSFSLASRPPRTLLITTHVGVGDPRLLRSAAVPGSENQAAIPAGVTIDVNKVLVQVCQSRRPFFFLVLCLR